MKDSEKTYSYTQLVWNTAFKGLLFSIEHLGSFLEGSIKVLAEVTFDRFA